MNCASCGKQIEEKWKFCNGCGRPIAAAAPRESSEIKNAKAAAFFGVIVLLPAILLRVDRNPEMIGPLTGWVLSLSSAAWGLSKVLPAGWLDMKRTIALAALLSVGIVTYIQFAGGDRLKQSSSGALVSETEHGAFL